MLRAISRRPLMIYVGSLLMIFILLKLFGIDILGASGPLCDHIIKLECVRTYVHSRNTDFALVSSFMILDAFLLMVISLSFCINYEKIFSALEKTFGKKPAKTFWSDYNLSTHASLTSFLLVALLVFWLLGFWLIYSFSLFLLYVIFLNSNRQLALLLVDDTVTVESTNDYQEVFVDNLFIAEDENISALVGYSFLFFVSGAAFVCIQLLGTAQATDLVMKSVLAGAASVHLSFSTLKFRSVIERRETMSDMVASITGYRLRKDDTIHKAGAALPGLIERYRSGCLCLVSITWLVIAISYGYKSWV